MADATFTKDDIQNVLKRLDFHAPGPVKTTGVEYFGPEKDIPVVTLSTQSLENYRETLERVLAKINVHNVSEFKDFKPHVTISYGPFEGSIDSLDIPETIVLGAPQLWWGDDPLTV